MSKIVKVIILACVVIIIAGIVLFLLTSSFQDNTMYTYGSKKLFFGDYYVTTDQTKFFFVGKIKNIYSTSDGTIYGNITYDRNGRQQTILLSYSNFSPITIFERTQATLTEQPDQKIITPGSSLTALSKLQNRSIAFSIPIISPLLHPSNSVKTHLQKYIQLLNEHISCNQQFLEKIVGFSQTVSCTPYADVIVINSKIL